MTQAQAPLPPELAELVADADTGGRQARGFAAALMLTIGVAWSLFQLWYASPLPFVLAKGVFNDTEARAIHLGTGLLLAFLAFPAWRGAPRTRIPVYDWVLAGVGAFAGAYLFLFYNAIADRPGQPTTLDTATAVIGILLLFEATRRAVGMPMTLLAVAFLVYAMAGPYMPEVIAHKGASVNRLVSHMWLTTEGVYGIALGVSVSF